MKTTRIYLLLPVLLGVLFSGCNDWLDVQPKDKTLKTKQFSTELGVQSVLTGLYRDMARESLYGGDMTQFGIEAMANRYYYYTASSGSYAVGLKIKNLSEHKYTEGAIESLFTTIWRDSYSLIFKVNDFLTGVNHSTANITQARKDIMTGEAYGLRAYLHFDLFRLYGPMYSDEILNMETIPYNTLEPDVENFEEELLTALINEKASVFINKLLSDIEKAESLLKETDPIVLDPDNSMTPIYINDYYLNRNHRMNYYAVLALKARIYQYIGEMQKAAEIAESLLTKFTWADITTIASRNDMTLFSEVIFGISNLDQLTRSRKYYLQDNASKTYVSSNLFLNQIYDLPGDARWNLLERSTMSSDKFQSNNVSAGYYYKWVKNESSETTPAGIEFQPLIRLSEMLYIVVEQKIENGLFKEAIDLLNEHLNNRQVTASYLLGQPDSPYITNIEEAIKEENEEATKEALHNLMRKEYYRELGNEGQLFFYSKRRKLDNRFVSNTGEIGYFSGNLSDIYVIPIPKAESNF